MIHTSKQLKDKVRNISKGDNNIAKVLIRNFFMERFLERVSVSDYCNNFILKGGMLVASIIGVDMRATMDIDAFCGRFGVERCVGWCFRCDFCIYSGGGSLISGS